MPVLINPESEEVKERAKWEMFPTKWVPDGMSPGNPYRAGNEYGKAGAAYPKMLYRAQQVPGTGKWQTAMQPPKMFGFRTDDEWRMACEHAEQFTRDCQTIVNSREEHHRALETGEGWRDTPQEAVAHALALEQEISNAAANRNWQDRNMSDKAKAESQRFEDANFGHQAEIPRRPVVRRVKRRAKRKAAPEQAPANAE